MMQCFQTALYPVPKWKQRYKIILKFKIVTLSYESIITTVQKVRPAENLRKTLENLPEMQHPNTTSVPITGLFI